MLKRTLGQSWTLTILGENVYDIQQEPIKATVPSTVYSTLLEQGLMPDPYYRDNELQALRLMENDFLYKTEIQISEQERQADRVILRFEGIDTIADVYLDGVLLGQTNNMNRVWEFDITEQIRDDASETGYSLRVVLHSPTRFIAEAEKKCPVGASSDAMPGFPHIRKAACMYGWDWGPRLPDAGLFRPVTVLAVSTARLEQVAVHQEHHVIGKDVHGNQVDFVDLDVQAELNWITDQTPVRVTCQVYDPDGALVGEAGSVRFSKKEGQQTGLHIRVHDPRRWWPNGYGEQALYRVCVELECGEHTVLDTWEKRIGLRTVTVNTDAMSDEIFDAHLKNQQEDLDDGVTFIQNEGANRIIHTERQSKKVEGHNFAYEVNGLQIFAMGADYIPEDNLFTRQTRERTDMLLASAQEAHFNSLRIWGGGYFPNDFFYDVCDERGLLIWHDFMFACASYELTPEFEENISEEIRQNVRRLRSHACIALWCGNNEMESQYVRMEWPKTKKQYFDYIHLYEYIIPKIVHKEHPEAFYWPSSPSSGGNYENSEVENVGDTHYWGVWHGNEPFTAYRQHHYRFLSEFGFQSFPALQTVKRFTAERDHNIFSRVMEMHQRNTAANGKILNYLSQTYLYPKNFDELLYCSQLLQADAIRYGVEHFRRFRGTCMGTVVWQLNDIWPVASWASLDYYGNWKALHYAEKRMFAPVLLSCEEHGEIDQKPFVNTLPHSIELSADLHVANETAEEIHGIVRWSLRNADSFVIKAGEFAVTAQPYDGTWLPHLDFSEYDPLEVHLQYALEVNGEIVSSGTTLFCAPKHYHFRDPELTVSVEGDVVTVTAKNYAKSVSVETEDGILRLDDNFVDMEAGIRTFRILSDRDFTGEYPPSGAYRVRSVYEIQEQ